MRQLFGWTGANTTVAQRALVILGMAGVAAALLGHRCEGHVAWMAVAAAGLTPLGIHVLRNLRRIPLGWRLVTAGLAVRLLADTVWEVQDLYDRGDVPFPSINDVGYVISYGLLITGLILAAGGRARSALLDASIIATGFGVVDWIVLMRPYLERGGDSGAALQLALAYPVCDLLVFAAGLRVAFTAAARVRANRLLLTGLALLLAANTLFFAHAAMGFLRTVDGVDNVLWLLSYLTLGLAGLQRTPLGSATAAGERPVVSRRRRLAFAAAAIVGPADLIGLVAVRPDEWQRGGWWHLLVPVALTGTMSLLLVIRLGGLARVAEQRSAELDQRAAELGRRGVELAAALVERGALEQQLRHGALHDPITGLANRALLIQRMEWAFTRARPDRHHALLLLDLDRFKDVNDALGHGSGDRSLVAVAHRLSQAVSPGDTVARLGGDEFALFVEDIDPGRAGDLAEEIRTALKAPIVVSGRVTHLSASVGVVALSGGTAPRDALSNAELALHAAKAAGRDRVCAYRPELRLARDAFTRITEGLRTALGNGEFAVHYQPVVALPSERIVAVEALLRWTPVDGPVSPLDFIPVAEETGMIVAIGTWVLEQACRDARGWYERYGSSLTVNVSVRQLAEPDFADIVFAILATTGLPAGALVLEITESMFVGSALDASPLVASLQLLRAAGVRVAIDDFGTGYSSLSYLTQLPVDILKIDRSFVPTDVASTGDDHAFTRAVLQLGTSRRLPAIAEGIETAEQAKLLHDLGCPLAQGFHFARPGPAAQTETAFARLNHAVDA